MRPLHAPLLYFFANLQYKIPKTVNTIEIIIETLPGYSGIKYEILRETYPDQKNFLI